MTCGVIERESLASPHDYQALVVCLKTNKLSTWAKKIRELLPHVNLVLEPEELLSTPFPRLLLIHYEQLNKKLADRLRRFDWSLVAFDESQRLKKRSSVSSRMSWRFREARRRIVMSGTPMDKSPVDLWAQLRFAEVSIFGDNWKSFFERYLRPAGFMGYSYKFKAGAEQRFLDACAPVCLRVDRSVLDLKGSQLHKVPVELDKLQRVLYDELEKELVAEIGQSGLVTTPLKITLLNKLSQITGGFVKDDDGEVHRVGHAKGRALKRLLDRLDTPVVIFARYRPEIDRIHRMLGERYERVAVIDGRVKDKPGDKARTRIINGFQKGKYDALVCQVRTGGVGVDLFRARHAIFYSCTHSSIDFEQAKSRLERYGQENHVDFYFLMAQNSVDEDQFEALESKSDVAKKVFARLKKQHRELMTMAKEEKKAPKAAAKASKTETKTETKPAKAAAPEFKYGVGDLSKLLGIKDASTRVALRNKSIKKAGRSYGWNSKDGLQEVADKIRGDGAVKKAKGEAAPAAKASKDKPAKKAA